MNRQELQKSIISSLSWLSIQVDISNKLNLTDINVHAENFYRDLLNLAFGYNFININSIDGNAAAIDLGDENERIAIQVTSTSALAKSRHTVSKFIEKELYLKYDKLIILNIAKKEKHKLKELGNENFIFKITDCVWDVGDLCAKINNLDLKNIEFINEFLNDQLHVKPKEKLARNVETILKIVELLSDENHPAIGEGFLDEPFPQEKINKRFADHAEFLKREYIELYRDYGAVLDAVEKNSDISPVKIRRVAQHLRVTSDKVLTECGGDPTTALQKMLSDFLLLIQSNGFEADTGAAYFYIIKQLIKCNVFPNKEVRDEQFIHQG
ncbi:Putative uncharacterized protein [Halomonas sp. R57-5]|uniref:SMEK domain-containing protein n=1 Tax=Halomonas sp. R57-5 TaxID=1610576 RepID=UPI0005FC5A7B|nr:SMEK domain-containing protein [Halomonas sp. R57-5]CEP36838.1 Putative uncharacterized protein [Halomonas sp. R57-5]